MPARILIVAGSDSGGGAGIQADIKTVAALGGYAATAVTALTAQDTRGVHGVVPVDPGFVQQQMRVVIDDIGVDCVKTGMLHDAATIEAVAAVLDELGDVPVVVDPVMVAKGGAPLLEPEAVGALVSRLLPLARVLTPNAPEAEALTGMEVGDRETMERAAKRLVGMGCDAVYLKGGHVPGARIEDLLVAGSGIEVLTAERIDTAHTHGTGCTLASAIATGLGQGLALGPASARAQAFVQAAIAGAPGFGSGHGPTWHGHTVASFDPSG
ncbi:MAG: bifunctional hydroxymethylpyrimidine kinase/phosphomethylpyrimidine kinase [Defluviicoccus sp.]|nr:bifunctional hydroxymethylpyrimidine kinase/phosphomethylpyrimidine kinase [Defluviicoccus sp.]MDE0384758.1 bifunctional hydroxymethylpyrimidine kinase/phosphomethylpyrimidine kinase [Defluviicoccus sp.]